METSFEVRALGYVFPYSSSPGVYPKSARLRLGGPESTNYGWLGPYQDARLTPLVIYTSYTSLSVTISCSANQTIYYNGRKVTSPFKFYNYDTTRIAFTKPLFGDELDGVTIFDDASNLYTLSYVTEHGAKPNSLFLKRTVYFQNLTETGYDFLGWYYESTFTTQAQVGDTLTSDTTLYAKWEKSGGGGSTLDVTYNSQKIIDSEEVTPPVSVTYNGITIATLNAGDTKTLQCNGKVMASDVGIGSKTLQCSGKLMASDVVVEVGGLT